MKPLSIIYSMDEKTGDITRKAEYTLPAKKALIAYIMQYVKHDFNTWFYPDNIDGMRQSSNGEKGFYYDHAGIILAAYEQ